MLGIAIAALGLGFTALPPGFDENDKIVLGDGVTFFGLSAPAEVGRGQSLEITMVYRIDKPLPADAWTFLHIESTATSCRFVEDRPVGAIVDGFLVQKVVLTTPENDKCEPQRLEIYTGLYGRKSEKRIEVIEPRSLDDRIHAGAIELIEEDAVTTARVTKPSDTAGMEFWSHVRPWIGWLVATGLGMLFAFAMTRLLKRRPALAFEAPLGANGAARPPPTVRAERWRRWVFIVAIGVPLTLSLMAALDFIKDDAYISFRYTHNFVSGDGLVFNAGDRLEGYTNFLWTVMMVPFEAMGWDLFQVSQVIGTLLICGLILYLTRITIRFAVPDGDGDALRFAGVLFGPVWLASSSSVGLWTASGMEQPIAMFAPVLAAWLLWRRASPDEADPKGAFWSGIFMGLGCMSRPEVHAIALVLGGPLVLRTIMKRRIEKDTLLWFAGLFAVLVPCHVFRYAYYGTLVPNTFYVKTGSSTLVMLAGLQKLREMFSFNDTGVLLVLAPFAFITRQRRMEKLVSLGIALGFMVFMVKVGVDEMQWHRLYLPALPFLVLLAGLGLVNVVHVATAYVRKQRARQVIWGAAWIAVVIAATINFSFTYREMGGFNGRGDLAGTYHPDMGKFVTRHDRAGALVAFQDMGSTPYHAPDIAFLDFIGLVDRTIAHARYDYGLHAFTATENAKRQPEFDAEMREYFYRRNPEWTILTSYIPDTAMKDTTARFEKDPGPQALEPYIGKNSYQFGIWENRFKLAYTHVRTWARSAGYYMSLFRRNDLWKQLPGEVILERVPDGVAGVKAKFEGGLELLGSELQPETKERWEAFFTTWWKLTDPMPEDTLIFFHVEAPGKRVPFDSVPGDWMYPATRWKAGQTMEHRVLFEVPVDLPTGTYQVYMGVYRRSTGVRLKVVEGPNDGQDRVLLGTFEVNALIVPFDSYVKPTNIAEQRKYPERILEHHRQPGQ